VQFHLIVSVLVRLLSDLSNNTLDNSLVNSRGQESSNTRSMENICSEVQTVHSQSDQSDVKILEKNDDVKPTMSEIAIVHESDACELPEDIIALRYHYDEARARDDIVTVNKSDACELPEDIIALRHHYNEVRAMECDQSDVTNLTKNEDIIPEVNEIVLANEGDLCELLHEDHKQNINTTFHECNSLASIEVKNVCSLCDIIGDWKV